MSLKLEIRTMAHNTQRYDTAGDYFGVPGGTTFFRISDLGNEDMEFMVAIHELIEAHLCKKRGIKFEDIDKFDMANPLLEDPGSDPKAPYHKEHLFALYIERLLSKELGVNWKKYEKRLAEVCK